MVTERGLHTRRLQDWEWRGQGGGVVLIWTPVRAITSHFRVIRWGMLKSLLSCPKESQEQDVQRSMLLRKSLTMCPYPACNSDISLPLHPEYHHTQPKSVIFKMWKQFSSRLALLQVPSQHKCPSEAGSGQLHCGVGGLVCSALQKPHVALSVLGRKFSQPSAYEFPFPKSLAVINI